MKPTTNTPGNIIADMLTSYVVPLHVHSCNQYDAKTKSIYLTEVAYYGVGIDSIATAAHEASHYIQHNRWPILFKLIPVPLIGYFIRVFLELHASAYALAWMQKNMEITDSELMAAKRFLLDQFYTYTGIQFVIRIIILIAVWLLATLAVACKATPVQHDGRYRKPPMEWPVYYPDSLQRSKIN